MFEKKVNYWEVKIVFNVREGSHEAENVRKLQRNIIEGIGKNDMNCIEAEDIKVEIK